MLSGPLLPQRTRRANLTASPGSLVGNNPATPDSFPISSTYRFAFSPFAAGLNMIVVSLVVAMKCLLSPTHASPKRYLFFNKNIRKV